MLVRVLLQTSLVLWLAQQTLQGGKGRLHKDWIDGININLNLPDILLLEDFNILSMNGLAMFLYLC